MREFFRRERGITIIALVITIIVLLVLAGVGIAALTGDNGIIKKAENSQVEKLKAEEIDKIDLAYDALQIDKLSHGYYYYGDGNIDNGRYVITAEELKQQLDRDGEEEAIVEDLEGEILVTMPSENKYLVAKDGNITYVEPTPPPADQ